MEPMSLTIGAVVAALVLKAAEKAGEKGAESGWSAVSHLVERLRGHFRDRGDAEGETALVRAQDPPASQRHLAALAAAIDRQAEQDPTFAQELHDLVKETGLGSVKVQHVAQTAWGNQNVQNADVTNSSIKVDIRGTEK
jgi:hypothetical protein